MQEDVMFPAGHKQEVLDFFSEGIALLTQREREILRVLATTGKPRAEIAKELGISVNTVRTYLKRTCYKLGVNTRLQAVLVAFIAELVAIEELVNFTDELRYPWVKNEQLNLTQHEKLVLNLLATRGIRNKEIAEDMAISVSTAATHTKSIYWKLGVHSRVQAALVALATEFVTLETTTSEFVSIFLQDNSRMVRGNGESRVD